MIRQVGNKIFNLGQKKDNPDIKVAYEAKADKWVLVYQGDFKGLKKWLNHQKELADKRSFRKMIAEMSGTSYKAACEDMGIGRI